MAITPTKETLVDALVTSIGKRFRTFGGGRDSDMNPVAHWLKDKPLEFAAGVDVRAVVEHVLSAMNVPELIGAAKAVIEVAATDGMDDDWAATNRLRAAIEKAEGAHADVR